MAYTLLDHDGSNAVSVQMAANGFGALVTESLNECTLFFQGDKYLFIEKVQDDPDYKVLETIVYDGTMRNVLWSIRLKTGMIFSGIYYRRKSTAARLQCIV